MNRTIQVNEDDFSLIEATKRCLELDEKKAVSVLIEVGLLNLLRYPTGVSEIDKRLKDSKYQELIKIVKAVWTLEPSKTNYPNTIKSSSGNTYINF